MADLIIDVYQGTNRKCLAIGNHRISVGKPYGFLEKVESYKCDTKDILSCIGTANQWIPCSERLPVLYFPVMILTDDGSYAIAHVTENEDEYLWFGDGGHYSKDYVLFWMPLPEPPKE